MEQPALSDKVDARRKKILDLLAKTPICSPLKLAEETGVSTETIRKDLDALAADGQLIKVHGGVALSAVNSKEIPFDIRAVRHAEEKRLIAHAAVPLISSGDSVILEGCTTNLELAKALVEKTDLLETLIIITNSFAIAAVLDGGRKCRRFFFLGGWVNTGQYAVQGRRTSEILRDFYANKAFISAAALSNDYILTGYYEDDVFFQKAAIESAQQTVLMLDHSKFNHAGILTVARLAEIDFLVTDKRFEPKEKEEIEAFGITLVQAFPKA